MISPWIPSVVMTALISLAAWIGLPKLLAGAIDRAVQHKLDERLERIRAEIRSAETSIDALRTSALSGVTARQTMLDTRKLVAVERLWAALISMSSAKSVAVMTGSVKLDELLRRSNGTDSQARSVQQFAGLMLKGLLPEGFKYDPTPDRERPFLSAQAWSLFVAYRLAISHPVMVLTLAQSGIGADAMKADPKEALEILKAALPHFSNYIDQYGLTGLHLLIPRLEERLLEVLDADLRGVESHAVTVEAAADIIRKADAIYAGLSSAGTGPTPTGLSVQ
jgi:hypothetical protein